VKRNIVGLASAVPYREMLRVAFDQFFVMQRFYDMDDAISSGRFIEE